MNFDDFDHFQGTVKVESLNNFLNRVLQKLLTALFSVKLFLDCIILRCVLVEFLY
jgi:hypothetical protein